MGQTGIQFEGVWKKFQRGERHDSLRDLIPALARRALGRSTAPAALCDEEFWAVRDVSFDVERGHALGIIGPNGAGKSTVLKLLNRILAPTRGRCEIRGRVGALIEVAAGFHQDLTGRENVYLQGAILHMKRAEITRRFDDIVEFAGLQEFIDTPVKRYSSGMNARLGFSIAAHLEPDVLLIDEVLSVGDLGFQQRCIERMSDFKKQGVTVLFVSHNLQAVAGLCERALYLHREVRALGPTAEVIEQYVRTVERPRAPGAAGAVAIVRAELLDEDGRRVASARTGAALTLRVTYLAHATVEDLLLGFLVYRSSDWLSIYDANFGTNELRVASLGAGQQVVVDFHFRAHLTRGQYHLGCHVFDTRSQRYTDRVCPAGILTIEETRTFSGIADLEVVPAIVDPARALEPPRYPNLRRPARAAPNLVPHPEDFVAGARRAGAMSPYFQ
jgi:ABC-type polysaccharide/polyol phosphate transport system ATPase subunit